MFYSETLPKSPTSAAAARELVDRVGAGLPEAVLEDARLLISELAANAIEHARGERDIEVRVWLKDGVLRAEVYDDGPGFTWNPRRAEAGDERGWGLRFTDRVASRWAVETGNTTCVWFELDVA